MSSFPIAPAGEGGRSASAFAGGGGKFFDI
jgi:hypothetical protein